MRSQETIDEARNLFKNTEATQFIIVTIPTVMAASESARLAKALTKEKVPLRTIVINQVIQHNATESFMQTRRKDQDKALQLLAEDPGLRYVAIVTAVRSSAVQTCIQGESFEVFIKF